MSPNLSKLARLKRNVELREHQERVLKKLDNTDALLLYHGLGSGKTLSSLAATADDKHTDVVVPAALRSNYRKEIDKFTTGKTNRHVLSYELAAKNKLRGGDSLVLDEVQRLNNPGSLRSQAVIEAAPKYKKRILLSGTPIKNHPSELAPLLKILDPKGSKVPLDDKQFNEMFISERQVKPSFFARLRGASSGVVRSPKNLALLARAFRGKVDYHAPASEGFPSRKNSVEVVPMATDQEDIYNYITTKTHPSIANKVKMNLPLSKQELQNLNSFMVGARIVSNTGKPYGGVSDSPKMALAAKQLADGVKNNPRFKGMAYSNYLEGGIKEYASHLDRENVPYRMFSGEMSDAQKKQAVDDYNKGRVKALLISGAGAEGLDLKGTRLVQILEPHWNNARVEQAVGRAIRYKSHDHLPEEERHVDVKFYHTVHPDKWYHKYLGFKRPTSADQYLKGLADKKDKMNEAFLDVLRQEGSKVASEHFWTGFEKQARSIKPIGKIKGIKSGIQTHVGNGRPMRPERPAPNVAVAGASVAPGYALPNKSWISNLS